MIFRSILVATVSVGCGACADDSDQRVPQDQTTGRAPAAFVLADSPSAVIGDRDDAAHQLTFPVAALQYEGPTDRNQRWVRVGPAGEVSASLTIDAGVTLLDVGSDFAIVRTTDMLDVPEIRLYPMVLAR